MTGKNELKDVPKDRVEGKVAEYESLGYKVDKTEQAHGKRTIRATEEGNDKEGE